jgi:glycosyltransferase 2 family protein
MRRLKKIASLSVKTLIAGALIYWLSATDRLDARAFAGIPISGQTVSLVGLGAAAVLVGQWLLAVRLQLLLASGGLTVPLGRILGLTMIGSFTGIALPGLVGGDVVKAAYLCGDAPGNRSHALAAVIVDRVIGLYSLFLVGMVALLAGWIGGVVSTWNPLLLVAPAAVVGLTVGAALVPVGQSLLRFRLVLAIWEKVPRRLRNVSGAVGACMRQWGVLAATIGLSVVNHALVITTFAVAGLLLGDNRPLLLHFILSPLATVWNMVGLTPGGVGLTEGAFSFIYETYKTQGSADGAAIGLLGRGIQYLTFIAGGGLALLIVRMRPRPVDANQGGDG